MVEHMTIDKIFTRDTVLHLRIPFSFYLLPIFCFGTSQSPGIDIFNTIIVFIALHLFIYPGSNVYNSYMDKDTGSIGGLEHPPPVTKKLYAASILFDLAGLLLCSFSGWRNALIMAGYIAFSKAYSGHGVRLKKRAWAGWASVAFFQGGYTIMLAGMAAGNTASADWFTQKNLLGMLFATLIIAGSYPLTQVYQHGEDGRRGDYTISYRLGIKGTFALAFTLFSAATALAFYYFSAYYSVAQFLIFIACSAPVFIYLSAWFLKTLRNPSFADYRHAMLMNKLSSFCMIVCFITICILNYK
jgi:1,4-dihydroxy-2-naphthoate octaprenyltransferase